MRATHITQELNTNRKLANRVIKALNDLTDCDNGTIRHPYELASVRMSDDRTLIETLYEDGKIQYNDGYMIVEADEYTIYVDYTTRAVHEFELPGYGYITNIDGMTGAITVGADARLYTTRT